MTNELKESLTVINKYTDLRPKIGIILGSGLGLFADKLEPISANQVKKAVKKYLKKDGYTLLVVGKTKSE